MKQLPDPRNYDSDWDYYDALEAYFDQYERDDYEGF